MGREEQIEEREVLDSIFPDEITDISETEYRISIALDIPDDEADNEAPVMLLMVRYPDEYPDKAPHLELSADDGESKHPFFNVAEDKDELLKSLGPIIEENMGMAMVFTLVTTLKEEGEQLVMRRREAVAKVREEEMLAAEREENKKFHGALVTRESFLMWREGFLKDMEEQRQKDEDERLAEMKKARIKESAKLTGRQLWERGLAQGEEVEDGDDDAPVEDMEKLKVSA